MSNSVTRYALVITILLGAAARADAGAVLVRDIGDHRPPAVEEFFTQIDEYVVRDGTAYFLSDDGIHGRELWRSDGTSEGTYLLHDLCPGSCGVAAAGARLVARLGDGIAFVGDDGVHGLELWATDGQPGGARLVRDFRPGLRSGAPRNLIAVGSRLFLTAEDGVHGRRIWVTDGSPTGSAQVAPLHPIGAASLDFAAELDGALVFGSEVEGEVGLWRSDGTAEGTVFLAPLRMWARSWPVNAPQAVVGDRLFFNATDTEGALGTLWVTDGTPAGTAEFLDVEEPVYFAGGAGRLFFRSGSETIWSTDGTPEGSHSATMPLGVHFSGATGQVSAIGSILVFPGWDEDHGREPWASDGSAIWPLGDLLPGPGSSLPLDSASALQQTYTFVAAIGDHAVFFAADEEGHLALWRTDGSAQGTGRVPDSAAILDGGGLAYHEPIFELPVLDGRRLFRTRAESGERRLWATDGKKKGTEQIAILDGQTDAFVPRNEGLTIFENLPVGNCFAPFRAGLVFSAWSESTGNEPWVSDGTLEGTELAEDLTAGKPGVTVICRPIHGRAVVEAGGAGQQVLASLAAPGEVEPLGPLESGGSLANWAEFDDAWFFAGDALNRTDGSAAGTTVVEEELEEFLPYELEAVGELLFVSGYGLSVTDGSAGGLRLLLGAGSETPHPYPERLTAFGESLLFFASDEAGFELWRSDGTVEGTRRVADLRPGPDSAIDEDLFGWDRPFLTRIAVVGSRALFSADDGMHGEELWVTDGTETGTAMVADLVPGPYPSVPRELVTMGDLVYFTAEAPGSGRELWKSDGTAAGTTIVVDLVPEAGSPVVEHLTAGGSELYFSAWTPERGREAWRLRHGATPLVAPLAEIAPGPLSSSPEIFLEIGGAVFTVANDNVTGFELWLLREDDSIFSDGFEGTTTEVWTASAP